MKLWILAQSDGHSPEPIVVLPSLRLEVKAPGFKPRQNIVWRAGLVTCRPLAIFQEFLYAGGEGTSIELVRPDTD